MDPVSLEARLREAAQDPDELVPRLHSIVAAIEAGDSDRTDVRTILTFMENHPTLDFGTPGPLVHYVERFFGSGYEVELYASLSRRPMPHTVWMLNRIINATSHAGDRAKLIALLERAGQHEAADETTRRSVASFLKHQLR